MQINLPILYEDEHMVAINKPAGLLVHRSHVSKDEPTVVDWFLARYPTAHDVGEEQVLADGTRIRRPGVVHRLDKETSGVLVLAKTKKGYSALKEQFLSRNVRKKYVALVHGTPVQPSFVVDRPIAKHMRDFRRFTSLGGKGGGRPAETNVVVIERFDRFALVDVCPLTGRTHQIRVHLADEGYPVVCDRRYAQNRVCPPAPIVGLRRQALHAASLTLVSPSKTEPITVNAPLADDIVTAIAELKGV